jgi:hypothetical protein
MHWMILAACLAITTAAPAFAQVGSFVQFRKNEPVTVQPDKAYVLIRALGVQSSVFILREPSESELAAHERAKKAEYDRKTRNEPIEEFAFEWDGATNFYDLNMARPYAMEGKDTRVVLAEVPPGEYVIYGIGWRRVLTQCHCMGSVGFTARPGFITDLGTSLVALASEPSPFPDLADEAGFGRVARMDFQLFAATVRPPSSSEILPAALANLPRQPAQFRAIGPWIDPRRVHANRLGAVPGVLEYRDGIAYDPVEQRLLRLPPDPRYADK